MKQIKFKTGKRIEIGNNKVLYIKKSGGQYQAEVLDTHTADMSYSKWYSDKKALNNFIKDFDVELLFEDREKIVMNKRTENVSAILEGLNESPNEMTKEKFLDYVRIQMSGVTNMFDVRRVCSLSKEGLTKDDCLDIMKNYDKYRKQWCKN